MVLRHFQLREQPFGVTPDPRYLYASPTHREALASLLYAIATGVGFVTLTGMPGMGKTTLLFDVLRRMKETTKTVFLFQTINTPAELVRALLLDMGVEDIPAGLVDMQTRLNELLVTRCASGRPLILIIDEAQNLNESVLEAVRMLSNFETASRKLMQIILSGQPQLAEILARPRMVQLRQRISVFARLQRLSESETAGYIHHRLEVAGFRSAGPIFTDAALALIAQHGRGIPRQINNICFNALSLACALQHRTIDRKVVEEVVADLEIEHHSPAGKGVDDQNGNAAGVNVPSVAATKPRIISWVAATCAVLVVLGGLGFQYRRAVSPPRGSVREVTSGQSSEIVHLAGSTPTSAPESSPQAQWVLVRKGQTLSGICSENFSDCSPEVLKEIVRSNPSILHPDHIKPGQSILIPVPSSTSTKSN